MNISHTIMRKEEIVAFCLLNKIFSINLPIFSPDVTLNRAAVNELVIVFHPFRCRPGTTEQFYLMCCQCFRFFD